MSQGHSPESAASVARHELESGDALRTALDEVVTPRGPPVEPPGEIDGKGLRGGGVTCGYGARTLLRKPGLTAVALLTLSLGIGATTAIFSVVNEVLLRRLPFEAPDRIIYFMGSAPDKGLPEVNWPDAFYAHFNARSRTLKPVAIYTTNEFNLTGKGEAERIQAANVTAGFFPLLGVQPSARPRVRTRRRWRCPRQRRRNQLATVAAALFR